MGDRKELTFNIIVTAVEQGIGYWADVREYHWSNGNEARVQVRESEGAGDWVQVDQAWVEDALATIRNSKGKGIHGDYLREILLADLTDGEQGDLDADAADIIFQVGLLNEVVYG